MEKAIFFDLQGTLGGEAIGNIEWFTPYPFSKDALSLSKKKGFLNIVITNQSNIGKGLISVESYEKTRKRILNYFNSDAILVDDFLCCPHQSQDNCDCKKPKIGLIPKCVEKYSIDLRQLY